MEGFAMSTIKQNSMTPAERAAYDNTVAGVNLNGLNINDLMNALVELGELFAEQDDALVELAELIEA